MGDGAAKKFGGKTKFGEVMRLPQLVFLILSTVGARCSFFYCKMNVSWRNCKNKRDRRAALGRKRGVYWWEYIVVFSFSAVGVSRCF